MLLKLINSQLAVTDAYIKNIKIIKVGQPSKLLVYQLTLEENTKHR